MPPSLLQHWWLDGPAAIGVRAWSHGELWMLAAAAAMAVGTVLCRYASRHSDPVAVTAWHMLIGGLPLALLTALPVRQGAAWLPAWGGLEWGLMAYATLFGSALAYGLFFSFASRGDLTGFTALTFLTPVFALVCGVLWLGEQLRPLQWLGAGLALLSVLLINRRAQLWQGGAAGALGVAEEAP